MAKNIPCLTLYNGVKMPQLGLGVWQTEAGAVAETAVKNALQLGYRLIDTAMIYGNEESVGAGIRASGVPREEIFVTTKLWNDDQGYEQTLAAFEASRKRLGLDYIDLYLIHWPRSKEYIAKHGKTYLESWRAMEKLYAEKKVRAIGVANFYEHHLKDLLAACKVRPMVDQFEMHPLLNQKDLRAFCAKENIVVTAYAPLGKGSLPTNEKVVKIGKKYGKTGAQVILRWDIQHGVVTIPKTVHEQRMNENADVFDFKLSDEDMAAIDAMNTGHRFYYDADIVDLHYTINLP